MHHGKFRPALSITLRRAANFSVISAAFDAPIATLPSKTPQDFEGLFRESETHSSGSSGNNILKGWVAVTASYTAERQIHSPSPLIQHYYLLFEIENRGLNVE